MFNIRKNSFLKHSPTQEPTDTCQYVNHAVETTSSLTSLETGEYIHLDMRRSQTNTTYLPTSPTSRVMYITNGRLKILKTHTITIAILSTHRILWHNLLARKWQAGVTTGLSKIRWKKRIFDISSLIDYEPMSCPVSIYGIKYWATVSFLFKVYQLFDTPNYLYIYNIHWEIFLCLRHQIY